MTGVEPIAEMRAVFERPWWSEAVEGTAESIPLDDGIADAVTARRRSTGSIRERALPELHRVLRPRGGVALIWNLRDESHPLHQAYAETLRPYKGEDYPLSVVTPAASRSESPLFADVEEREFAHSQTDGRGRARRPRRLGQLHRAVAGGRAGRAARRAFARSLRPGRSSFPTSPKSLRAAAADSGKIGCR